MFNILKLLKAKRQLKKLKKYINEQNLMILGRRVQHDTKLIDILAVGYLFLNELGKKFVTAYKEDIGIFFKMQAHAILAADLVNAGADKVVVGYKWNGMEDLIKKIKKDEPELGALAKAHWTKANSLLKLIEKRTKKTISKEFKETVSKGLSYLRKELEFSNKLTEGNVRFAKSFINKEFQKDPSLAHLTHDRISVIYEFIIDSFYKVFIEVDPFPNYPKQDFLTWASKLAIVLQEAWDDIDDIEDDIPKLKPTPIILRMLKEGSIMDGINNSRIWNMNIINSLDNLKILPPVRKTEKILVKKVKSKHKKILRKRKTVEKLMMKYFVKMF